ncbi:MAG: tetratricopeptide repeat-containing serine protease family protein [Thermosynechococcaceae cyanobacterium MS004]|nr:tetratricopeptide repeat-containing serine protease family protein [Thermosynechococcaceae cyanobacterium MS004]
MSELESFLNQCTVKLSRPEETGWGTGFFVTPEWILTCTHVIEQTDQQTIRVKLQSTQNWATAIVVKSLPEPYDLALLKVTSPVDRNTPCAYLEDKAVQSRDELYMFGYPDKDFPNGCPVTFTCEGLTGDEPALIKFAAGQVRPGMSGSPLLNQRTGKVCGIIKFTRERSSDLGGGAVPSTIILTQFPELVEQQRSFHQQDQRWNNLVIDLSRDLLNSQNNLGNTVSQTQLGVDNTIFNGGTHFHGSDVAQVKQVSRTILILPSNPKKIEHAIWKQNHKEIRDALRRAKNGKQFYLEERSDISASELSQELSAIEPYIINIFGRDSGIEKLAIEENPEKNSLQEPRKSKLIAELLQLHNRSIKCIVMNRCYSEIQAKEIVQYVDFLIGVSDELEDSKSSIFIEEFYYQLGCDRTIRDAYKLSCNLVERKGYQDINLLTRLLSREDELKHRDLKEKLKLCEKEIESDSGNVELWKKKAVILKELGRIEESIQSYERASLLSPNDYKIRTEQGNTLKKFGRHIEAVDAYDKALELEEKDYNVWWKKGKALVEVEQYNEALESYEKAALLEPPSPDNYVIYREYGFILEKQGKFHESIALYKKSLRSQPKYRVSSYEKKWVHKKIYSCDS